MAAPAPRVTPYVSRGPAYWIGRYGRQTLAHLLQPVLLATLGERNYIVRGQ